MKKNYLRIPSTLLAKAEKMKEDSIVVFALLKVSSNDIASGDYSHLKIYMQNGDLRYDDTFLPAEEQGKYSNWNINGREIKRKDLPKERFYNYVESPNWGDSYNGTHTVALPGERYPVEFIPPRLATLKTEVITQNDTGYLFRFSLSEVLNKKAADYLERFLVAINILQENVGSVDIIESSISSIEYLKTQSISWEILPPGEKEKFITRYFSGKSIKPEEKKQVEDRYDYFMRLKPKEMIIGINSFQRYFGAKIEDDIVLFENTEYGNALYIMFNDWEELSKKSRIELLSGRFGRDFERVIHTGDWKEKVKLIISKNKKKK